MLKRAAMQARQPPCGAAGGCPLSALWRRPDGGKTGAP
jgi:hypothetical protein